MVDIPAVLVIDENEDSRVELRRLLTRAGLTVAGEARYGASATATANDLHPDAVVIGIEEPPNRAIETIEALARLMLDTPIVAYSSIDEAGAIRRATRAGICDYLVRPLDTETVRESITTAIEQEERRRQLRAGDAAPAVRGSVVTISGAKGGIGKSVVAINLALALRQVTGRTVALADLDTHFGDVAMMLKLPDEPPVTRTIARAPELTRGTVLEQTVPHASGVRVLPGALDPEEWDQVDPANVERLVGLLAESFDFVVVDTPDVLDPVVERSVRNSTLILLVTNLDISSIADTKVALRILRRWEVPPENVLVVANHTRRDEGLRESHVREALDWPIFWSVPYDKRVPYAAQLGEALVARAPKADFSRSFRALAGAISGAGSGEPRPERPARIGGLARFFRGRSAPATPEVADRAVFARAADARKS